MTDTPITTTAPGGLIAAIVAAPEAAVEAVDDSGGLATAFSTLLDSLATSPATVGGVDVEAAAEAEAEAAAETEGGDEAVAATVAGFAVPMPVTLPFSPVPVTAPVVAETIEAPIAAVAAGALPPVPVTTGAEGEPDTPPPAVVPVTTGSVTAERHATVERPATIAMPDAPIDEAIVQAAIAAVATTAKPEPSTRPRRNGDAVSSRPSETATATATATVPSAPPAAAPVAPAAARVPTDQPKDGQDNGRPAPPADPLAGVLVDRRGLTTTDTTSAPPSAIETIDRERIERLAEGLAVRLRASQASDGARIRMLLEPRELGEVIIRLDIRDGVAQAFLTAESHESAKALQAALGDLRTALADRGLNLERIDVRVAGDGAREGVRDGAADARHGRSAHHSSGSAVEETEMDGTTQTDASISGHAVWILA